MDKDQYIIESLERIEQNQLKQHEHNQKEHTEIKVSIARLEEKAAVNNKRWGAVQTIVTALFTSIIAIFTGNFFKS